MQKPWRHFSAFPDWAAPKRRRVSCLAVADDLERGRGRRRLVRHISAQTIVQRAMRRLEAKGRGILLLHDIHPATAMALPSLLKELKAAASMWSRWCRRAIGRNLYPN